MTHACLEFSPLAFLVLIAAVTNMGLVVMHSLHKIKGYHCGRVEFRDCEDLAKFSSQLLVCNLPTHDSLLYLYFCKRSLFIDLQLSIYTS